MIGCGIQRVEAMPFVFDIRPIREREPHSAKNADGAVEHLGERVEGTDLARRAGERDVDLGERFSSLARPAIFLPSARARP